MSNKTELTIINAAETPYPSDAERVKVCQFTTAVLNFGIVVMQVTFGEELVTNIELTPAQWRTLSSYVNGEMAEMERETQ